MKRWHGFALAGVAASVVGCGAGGGSDPVPPPTRETSAITVTPSSTPRRLPPRKSSPKPVARPTTHRPTPVATSIYYANCTALRKDHPNGVQKGQPGYRSGLDRDGDDTACEATA